MTQTMLERPARQLPKHDNARARRRHGPVRPQPQPPVEHDRYVNRIVAARVELGRRGDVIGKVEGHWVCLFKTPPQVTEGTWVAVRVFREHRNSLVGECLFPFRQVLFNVIGPGLVKFQARNPEEAEAILADEIDKAKALDRAAAAKEAPRAVPA